jgi:hypothetical protein
MAFNYTKTGLILGVSYAAVAVGLGYFGQYDIDFERGIFRGLDIFLGILAIAIPIDLVAWYRARRGWIATPLQRYERWRAAGWGAFAVFLLFWVMLLNTPKPESHEAYVQWTDLGLWTFLFVQCPAMMIAGLAPFMARRARKQMVEPVPLEPQSSGHSRPPPSSPPIALHSSGSRPSPGARAARSG